jgi:hypothetical protein
MNSRIVVALFVAIILGSTMHRVLPKRNPEQDFWKWFSRHWDEVFHLERDRDRIFAALDRELKAVNPHLTFEFSAERNGKREFVVSADGISEAFPAVQRLVAAAPPLERWKIVAFRQRKALRTKNGPAFYMEYEGYKLQADDVFFRAAQTAGGKIGLELFVRNYTPNDERIQYAVFLMLDCALGEYDVETRIGSIEIKPLPEPSRRAPMQSFYELPQTVDSYYTAKRR